MKKILLTHTDLDGLGARLILEYLNIDFDKTMHCDYDQFESEQQFAIIEQFDHITCTDYSLSIDLVNKLLGLGKIVEIYDHHASSEQLKEIIHENFKIVHDMTVCGTRITFDAFKSYKRYKRSLIQFIDLVNCYDLFNESSPLWENAQNMNRVLWHTVNWNDENNMFKFILEYWLTKIDNQDSWSWSKFEKEKIDKALRTENEEYTKSKVSFKIHEDSKGLKFGVTVAPKKVSIIANRLLKAYPEVKYVAIINTYDGWNKISLRSRSPEEFNCTQIANGHECAAGMEITEENAKAFYKGTYQLEYKGGINE